MVSSLTSYLETISRSRKNSFAWSKNSFLLLTRLFLLLQIDRNRMDTNLVTQILWGRTTHVGCGWTQFPLKEGTSRFQGIYAEGEYENFFVCNYGVGGNVPGEPVYQMNCSNDTASKGIY